MKKKRTIYVRLNPSTVGVERGSVSPMLHTTTLTAIATHGRVTSRRPRPRIVRSAR